MLANLFGKTGIFFRRLYLTVMMQYNNCNDKETINTCIVFRCMMDVSPFFSYALGIIENNGLVWENNRLKFLD